MATGTHASAKLQSLILDGCFKEAFPTYYREPPFDFVLELAVAGTSLAYIWGQECQEIPSYEESGSARWGMHADIEPYIDPEFQNNVILSQSERLTMSSRPKNPKYARNKNVLIVGGSGSGKTRFVLKPNLLQMHSSYVVTDPNGYTISR